MKTFLIILILLFTLTSTATAHQGCGSIQILSKFENVVIRVDIIIAMRLRDHFIIFFINGSKIELRFNNKSVASIRFKKVIKKWRKCYKEVK